MKYDERTYEAWFDKYLGDIENVDRINDPSPLKHQPKIFRFWLWTISLTISIIACGIISFVIFNKWEWVSNLMLNFSAGLFASLILLCFTTSKDKNINYANDVLPVLRLRYSNMKDALDESFVPLQQAIQQNLYDEFNDYAKLLANTQCVISNFITYLSKVCRYKPQYLMECCNKSDEFFNDCKTLSDISFKLINEKDANLFVEAREFEHKVRWQFLIDILMI